MKLRCLLIAVLVLVSAGVVRGADGSPKPQPILVTIHNDALNHVDDRLFGHFMERASWGEPGYDAARVGESGKLDPRVTAILKRWDVPVIRWPGGSDVRRIDWRDMIDGVPGREGGRPLFDVSEKHPPLTNRFGVDEFLQYCEALGAEPLLPVNFGVGLQKRMDLERASLLAAGMVAYCNAPVGAELPKGMPDWPVIRAANGRTQPYNVRYFQIGNEVWHYAREAFEQVGMGEGKATTAERAQWYLKCFNAYADAMKRVDPHIELITELNHTGRKIDPKLNDVILADEASMRKAAWFVRHTYAPWAIRQVLRDGQEVSPGSLSEEQVWNAWVSTPRVDPVTGEADLGWARELRSEGRRIAVTEWNWNGWWQLPAGQKPPLDSDLAKGVGAAGWLHAFMRMGDVVHMACQSMTIGSSWGITGVRVDPKGEVPPYPLPTGQVTGLYSRYHGNVRLGLTHANVPSYSQPLRMAGLHPAKKVLVLDMVATASEEAIYLHLINRSFSEDLPVTVDLSAFGELPGLATLHALTGRLENKPEEGETRQVATVSDTAIEFEGATLTVGVPKRSVSVLEIPRRGDTKD